MNTFSLLSDCGSGGCGAKIGPGELAGLLAGLPARSHPKLLVGFDSADDAAVYSLPGGQCLVSTADFFSPMVEDARSFGRIAAANAMSDVWAMGAKPVLALNLVCFPERADTAVLGQILAGGAEKIAEAGAVLGGGHSIYDKEAKYGLAVTGLAPESAILRNNSPRAGDRLILTKALGVGIVLAAQRVNEAAPAAFAAAVAGMERLNRCAAEAMAGFNVSACTDVTGFGLICHLLELCGTAASARLWPEALPLLPGAADYANAYLLTAAGQRNRVHAAGKVNTDALPFAAAELLFDPQTSGGLLIAVDAAEADALLAAVRRKDPAAAAIGEITRRGGEVICFG